MNAGRPSSVATVSYVVGILLILTPWVVWEESNDGYLSGREIRDDLEDGSISRGDDISTFGVVERVSKLKIPESLRDDLTDPVYFTLEGTSLFCLYHGSESIHDDDKIIIEGEVVLVDLENGTGYMEVEEADKFTAMDGEWVNSSLGYWILWAGMAMFVYASVRANSERKRRVIDQGAKFAADDEFRKEKLKNSIITTRVSQVMLGILAVSCGIFLTYYYTLVYRNLYVDPAVGYPSGVGFFFLVMVHLLTAVLVAGTIGGEGRVFEMRAALSGHTARDVPRGGGPGGMKVIQGEPVRLNQLHARQSGPARPQPPAPLVRDYNVVYWEDGAAGGPAPGPQQGYGKGGRRPGGVRGPPPQRPSRRQAGGVPDARYRRKPPLIDIEDAEWVGPDDNNFSADPEPKETAGEKPHRPHVREVSHEGPGFEEGHPPPVWDTSGQKKPTGKGRPRRKLKSQTDEFVD